MRTYESVGECLVCNSNNADVQETTKTMMAPQSENWTFRQCKNCQMVFLSPRVQANELDKYYTDTYLPYRGESAWGKFSNLVLKSQKKIDEKRLATVKKYVPELKSILDVGCGKPSFLQKVKSDLDIQAIGIDFSDKGWVDNASVYKNLQLHEGLIFDLPTSVKADAITMWHYLEHDYDPGLTLKHLSQNQDVDSTIFIEVPNFDSYTRKKYGRYWSGYHTPRHTALFTPETLTLLLESCGWEVEDQYTHGTLDPYTLDWMSRMEMEKIDWSGSMEPYFYSYVFGKMMRPRYYFDRMFNLGFMTVVAKNKKSKFKI